jgi:hypothetical protein
MPLRIFGAIKILKEGKNQEIACKLHSSMDIIFSPPKLLLKLDFIEITNRGYA